MTPQTPYDRIEEYLRGTLSGEEKMFFEKQLTSDPELKMQLEQHREADRILMEYRLSRLKTKMQSDLHLGVADRVIFKWQVRRWLWSAVGVATLATSAFVVIKNTSEKTVKENTFVSKKELENENPATEKSVSSNIAEKKSDKISKKAFVVDSVVQPASGPLPTGEYGNAPVVTEIPEKTDHTTPAPEKIIDPCVNAHVTVKGYATETCEGKQEGVIDLDIYGNAGPYQCGWQRNNSEEIVWNKKGVTIISQLSAGSYKVMVKDKSGCLHSPKEIFMVHVKQCKEIGVEEYSFKPEYGEQLNIEPETDGSIVIYDQGSKEIYQSSLKTNVTFNWDGIDQYGKTVPKGMYLFVIRYTNGNIKKGYITVY